jgi:hypothetical protein
MDLTSISCFESGFSARNPIIFTFSFQVGCQRQIVPAQKRIALTTATVKNALSTTEQKKNGPFAPNRRQALFDPLLIES